MATACVSVLLLLALLSGIVSSGDEKQAILLDDDNFEHLTQASTGATTGDWLVLFTKEGDNCGACKESRKCFERLNERLSQKLNVAVINPLKNDGLLRRFGIKHLPLIMLFRHGYQYVYTGDLAEDKIEEFAVNSYKEVQKQPVKKPLSSFDIWKEDTIQEIMNCIKYRQLPSYSTLGIAIGSLVIALAFLLCCCSGTSPDESSKKNQ